MGTRGGSEPGLRHAWASAWREAVRTAPFYLHRLIVTFAVAVVAALTLIGVLAVLGDDWKRDRPPILAPAAPAQPPTAQPGGPSGAAGSPSGAGPGAGLPDGAGAASGGAAAGEGSLAAAEQPAGSATKRPPGDRPRAPAASTAPGPGSSTPPTSAPPPDQDGALIDVKLLGLQIRLG